MTYDWGQCLLIADRFATKDHEALQRTAISRAYYAAFNLCRDWLEAHAVRIPDSGAHRAVWNAFGHGEAAKGVAAKAAASEIASHGRWLSRRRNHCDYNDRVPNLVAVSREALQRAHQITDDLLPSLN